MPLNFPIANNQIPLKRGRDHLYGAECHSLPRSDTCFWGEACDMKDILFGKLVDIWPKPGVVLMTSQTTPSLPAQARRNLQESLHERGVKALDANDVVILTFVVLLVAVVADILFTLCTRKCKRVDFFNL